MLYLGIICDRGELFVEGWVFATASTYVEALFWGFYISSLNLQIDAWR